MCLVGISDIQNQNSNFDVINISSSDSCNRNNFEYSIVTSIIDTSLQFKSLSFLLIEYKVHDVDIAWSLAINDVVRNLKSWRYWSSYSSVSFTFQLFLVIRHLPTTNFNIITSIIPLYVSSNNGRQIIMKRYSSRCCCSSWCRIMNDHVDIDDDVLSLSLFMFCSFCWSVVDRLLEF